MLNPRAGDAKNWLSFMLLSLIWGASFFWQKYGLVELGPSTLVAGRFTIALVIMLAVMAGLRLRFPRSPTTWMRLFLLSIVYSSVPVFLSSWAGSRIDTTVGSVLNATSPLFTVVFATLVFNDEKATRAKTLGTLVGFVGMLVIVLASAAEVALGTNEPLGVVAQIGTSICYALAPIASRKLLRDEPIIVQGTALVALAGGTMWIAAAATEPIHLPTLPATWAALLWLGALSSAAANLLYFSLLRSWGSTRSSLISYMAPIIGVALGAVLLGEHINAGFVAGAALILIGVFIANRPAKSVGVEDLSNSSGEAGTVA